MQDEYLKLVIIIKELRDVNYFVFIHLIYDFGKLKKHIYQTK